MLPIQDLSHSNANANAMSSHVNVGFFLLFFLPPPLSRNKNIYFAADLRIVRLHDNRVGAQHIRMCTVPLKSQFDSIFSTPLLRHKKEDKKKIKSHATSYLTAVELRFCFILKDQHFNISVALVGGGVGGGALLNIFLILLHNVLDAFVCIFGSTRFCFAASIFSLAAVSFSSVVNADVCAHHTLHWEIEENGKSYSKHLR